ncbi:fimbrial protein [Collimonas silvisoli]|uniref:fimbrial protein n=1 Tax=Collimonas silvisoli TaxID=2825884 RepID=UPI001B8C0AC0|nr:fimbrial protein [Collimonas silvisoli]
MKQMTITKLIAIAAAGLFSQAAFADGGTVNFSGKITDSPCGISASSINQLVQMGTVPAAKLNGAAGKKADSVPFTILLTDCGVTAKGATVTFSGVADATVTDILRISNAGQVGISAATGVGIELGDSAGAKIPLGSASGNYVLGVGNNPLKFMATYVSTGPAVTVGPADSSAQFVVAYN